MKKCNVCNIEKPLSEFSKDKSKKDGLQYKCKECTKQHNKDNKESIDKHNKQYREDNREYVNEYQLKLAMSEGYGVYMITHIPTQCYYIGEGWIRNRRIAHFSELKREVNGSGGLQRFFNQHPNIEDYKFEVIKKWDDHNKVEGEKLEEKLIIEGLNNNSAKILNIRVG
tara:strand:- start:55 stop:561 length:507 start_codon:yes stop_codon:yes gene_type:complete